MSDELSITVIVPVLHEAASIDGAIDNIRAIEGGNAAEIIVVDGDESKDTISTMKKKDVIKLSSKKGRFHQMNEGAKDANGDVLLFLHADTKLPTTALKEIRDALKDPSVVGGGFHLRFDPSNPYLGLIELLNVPRVNITRIPYGDHAIFMRRNVFKELGGYSDVLFMEDVEIMRRVRKKNMRIAILKGSVLTSSRRFRDDGYIKHSVRFFFFHLIYWLGASTEWMGRHYKK
jgi:rSAM/selenodomain-associated transferase 2